LESLCEDFPYPIFIKEVGFGLSRDTIEWASKQRVAGVDVAGTGGTNWTRIEGLIQKKDYSLYEQLGISTSEATRIAAGVLREDQCLIASGGVRTGIDIAKCFALGAQMVSMALPFLRWADGGVKEVIRGVETIKEQLSVCLWYSGCHRVSALKGRITSSPNSRTAGVRAVLP
jgi:isopentenyl-diphosphate Delta-isomerase